MIIVALVLVLWWAPAWAAPLSVDIDKNINLKVGTRTFPGLTVPDDVSRCEIDIDRTDWKLKQSTLRVWLETSIDGGVTWRDWMGVTEEGGPLRLGHWNTIDTDLKMLGVLPLGTARQIRGGYALTGTRFTASVSVRCQ